MIAWVSDAVTYKVSNTEVKYPDHKERDNDGYMITKHVQWFIWAYRGNAGYWGCSDLRSIHVNCGWCQCLLGLGKYHLLSFIRIIQLCLRWEDRHEILSGWILQIIKHKTSLVLIINLPQAVVSNLLLRQTRKQPLSLHFRYGASLGGALCYINNPTLRLFSHTCLHLSRTCLHTTSDEDQTRRHKKHKQQTNTITMVVEPLTPSAAWIWWTHAAGGAGGLSHDFSDAAIKAI